MKKFSSYGICTAVMIIWGTLYSCGNKQEPAEEQKDFYPIAQYLKSELNRLDTLPLAIIKYTTINGITDTSVIAKPAFRTVAETLIGADVSTADKKKSYKETSFLDASLGTLSLTYTPVNHPVAVLQLNVLLQQDNTNVMSIYAEVESPGKDSTTLKKLLWTAKRSLQISTIVSKNGQDNIQVERYIWNEALPLNTNEEE